MELSSELSASILMNMISDFQYVYQDLVEQIIEGEDITLNQFYILEKLQGKGEISTVELANTLKISQPAVTQFTNKLVQGNYISKEHHSKDKRRIVCVLTPEGEEKLEHLKKKQLHAIKSTLQHMDEGKSQLLIEGLNHFIKAWKSIDKNSI